MLAIAEFIGYADHGQDAAHWPVFAVVRASQNFPSAPRCGVGMDLVRNLRPAS